MDYSHIKGFGKGRVVALNMENNRKLKNAYLGYNTNNGIRKQSSSGGMFYELAISVLKENGIIYGAAFDTDFLVKHIRVDSQEQLKRLLCSKYVQSDMKDIYVPLKNDLQAGKTVMFSGTPCQVKAILNYIINNRLSLEKLYLVDFICHGVPSPGVWNSYLRYISNNKKISEINFRNKSNAGWHDFYFHAKYEDNSQLNESHELNSYMRSFLSDKNIRPACYECQFKDEKYYSDITLGDAWKIEKEKPTWADDKGTSLFIVRSTKGNQLLQRGSRTFIFDKTDYDRWKEYNPSIKSSTAEPPERKEFFEDFHEMKFGQFWNKYSYISKKAKIKYKLKSFLRVTGTQKIIRKFVK